MLGGEVIQGGKQDRMIARDFLVIPNSGKVDIAVYCVEHGRWTDSLNLQFDVTVGFAPTTVREAIFITVPDEEELREVPPTQQAEVWKQVAELQEDLKVVSPTDALVEAMEDTKISTVIQPYQDFFNSVQWPVNVVGVVAVLNNEIVGCDIFAQHDLFMKYYPDLVPSYSDHVYRAGEKELLSYKEVRSFFMKTFNNDASLAKHLSEKGTQLMHKNKRLHLAVN